MGRRGTTERLGDILASLMQRRTFAQPMALGSLRDAWTRAVGARLAGRTRVVTFRDGVLTVEVASAAQRYELEAFHAPQLLAALQADPQVPGLRRLAFRVGSPPA
jgi:predicted nucleic acid-binding Zn ribbon protein